MKPLLSQKSTEVAVGLNKLRQHWATIFQWEIREFRIFSVISSFVKTLPTNSVFVHDVLLSPTSAKSPEKSHGIDC